jgi:glycosyltransferase involved in cell wall biosynthesis
VIIPTYERVHFLPQALKSVLAQDPGPDRMQIEVMDDCSTSKEVEAVVRQIGGDRITYTRQASNVGQFRNVNEGIRRARGRWLHILHDDDWVMPGFYATLEASLGMEQVGAPGAALTTINIHDRQGLLRSTWPAQRNGAGVLEDWLIKTATSVRVQTPAVVVRRDIYEALGGYNPDFPWPGDWEMWQRIAAHYAWWYEPAAIACYRDHETSVTHTAKRTASNMVEIRSVIDYAQHYLPSDIAPAIRDNARRYWAQFAFRTARRLIAAGDFEGGAAQISECLRTDSSPPMVKAVISMADGFKAGSSAPP